MLKMVSDCQNICSWILNKNTTHFLGWKEVAREFQEPVADCKKKWRHLRSSLSRYLKCSKDSSRNKNQRLKPYYLLTQMDFLIPFTKNLDPQQTQYATPVKFEGNEEAEGTSTIYGIETNENDTEMQNENENEESTIEDQEETDVIYETFEISGMTPQQQPQVHHQTLQTQHLQSPTKHNITISSPQILNSHSSPQTTVVPVISSNIPIACSSTDEQQSSADLNFFKSLLPDVKQMTMPQKRKLRRGVLKLIDDIFAETE